MQLLFTIAFPDFVLFLIFAKYVTGPGKQVLSTQNTLVRIMVTISCFVCALLNSSWMSAYMITF